MYVYIHINIHKNWPLPVYKVHSTHKLSEISPTYANYKPAAKCLNTMHYLHTSFSHHFASSQILDTYYPVVYLPNVHCQYYLVRPYV